MTSDIFGEELVGCGSIRVDWLLQFARETYYVVNLIEREGQTGKYLAQGQGLLTKRSKVRTS